MFRPTAVRSIFNTMARQNHQVTFSDAPPRPVYPLGQAPVHGPKREEHVVVVLGAGPGVGGSVARVFAQQGYTTALLSRTQARLDEQAAELQKISAQALGDQASTSQEGNHSVLSKGFSCDATDMDSIRSAVSNIMSFWPNKKIGTAVYNASVRIRKPFLELTDEDLRSSVAGSIYGGHAFAQATLRAMLKHEEGGNLIFTGASASLRGRPDFSSFNTAKGGMRMMAQAIAKEFQPQGIHVAHVLIDGLVSSKPAEKMFGVPEGERFPDRFVLRPEEIAKTYLFLAQQDPDVWTHEIDLRPANEKF